MSGNEITGKVRDRFIQGVVLLYLLDPVRGEPTAYGLDKDSSTVEYSRELFLKRKFLDSFALICALKKDPKTVSAACLEEGPPEGTVVRIASNAGVREDTMISLQRIVDFLSSIAVRDLDPSKGEKIVLLEIIQLDIVKIRQYMKLLKTSNNVFDEVAPEVHSRLANVASKTNSPSIQQFLDWFKRLFSITDLPNTPTPTVLLDYIVWAQKAKRLYDKFLSFAFANSNGSLPRWVKIVYKLGRYGIAARAFVQTSIEFPALFNPMVVKSVSAPHKVQYAVREEEKPLDCILRRVPEVKVEEAIPRLSSIWETADPETVFRKSCPEELITHAELQLVSFYDHNPTRRPQLKFVGVSKKSCYLCWRFLQSHPSGFYVSSCHQKLYKSWIPAPSTDLKVYKKYKNITLDMSKKMEEIAREELSHRLGPKRLMPADSTAGVSLSGLTELGNSEVTDSSKYGGVKINFATDSEVTNQETLDGSINLERPYDGSRPSTVSEMMPTSKRRHSFAEGPTSSFSSMVFHFKDQRIQTKQDIIILGSILDDESQIPSWSKLVDVLNSDDSFGLVSEDSAFLLVNENIRIRNERQFLACLQWLLNEGVRNSEVIICDVYSSAQFSATQGTKGKHRKTGHEF